MVEEPLQIGQLRTAFLSGELSVSELIERVLTRIARWDVDYPNVRCRAEAARS